MNKKAQNLTITTIVIIVLALIVLVVLILGFTSGWGNLWNRVTAFFGSSNVDAVAQACQMACTTQSRSDYCERERTVKFEDKTKNGKYNCRALENERVDLDACESYSDCEEIKPKLCTTVVEEGGLGGEWIKKSESCGEGKEDLTDRVTYANKKANKDKKCCVSVLKLTQ